MNIKHAGKGTENRNSKLNRKAGHKNDEIPYSKEI